RQLLAIPLEVQKVAGSRTLSKDTPCAFHAGQQSFNTGSNLFDGAQVRARDFQAYRSAHTGGQHVNPPLDGQGPRIRHARYLEASSMRRISSSEEIVSGVT